MLAAFLETQTAIAGTSGKRSASKCGAVCITPADFQAAVESANFSARAAAALAREEIKAAGT